MTTAKKIISLGSHPWEQQIDACLSLPVSLCILDVTGALREMNNMNLQLVDQSVFAAAEASSKLCDGIHVVATTPHLQKIAGCEDLETFRKVFDQVLRTSKLQQIRSLARAIQQASTSKTHSFIASTQPATMWTFKFVDSRVHHHKNLVIASIQESPIPLEQQIQDGIFAQLIEQMSEFVLLIDLNGNVTYANPGARSFLSGRKNLLHHSFQSLFSPASAASVLSACTALNKSPWSGSLEVIEPATGNPIAFQASIYPIYETNKISQGAFAIIGRPATDLEHLQRSLQQRNQLLEDLGQLVTLGQVSEQIVHEINHPISVIINKAEELLLTNKLPSPTQIHECGKTIVEMAQQADSILKTVKGIALKRSHRSRRKIALRQLLEDVRELMALSGRKAGTELRFPEVPSDIMIRGELIKLSQVLINLVANSYDATESLSERWVALQVEASTSQITIRVIDSGKGITKEIADKLFDEFFTTKEVGKGMGLGLTLSRQIVRRSGGDLFLDRNAKNTTFVMTLPRVRGDEEDGGDWEEI